MNRNSLIRLIGTTIGSVTYGAALGEACKWIIVSASLGSFLSFLVWLIALALAIYGGAVIAEVVRKTVTDERIDTSLATVRGWFTALKKVGA